MKKIGELSLPDYMATLNAQPFALLQVEPPGSSDRLNAPAWQLYIFPYIPRANEAGIIPHSQFFEITFSRIRAACGVIAMNGSPRTSTYA
jgi:hypothetical protein